MRRHEGASDTQEGQRAACAPAAPRAPWLAFNRAGARFGADQRGGTALEYCFIAFLISIVAISAMTQIGIQTQANTQSILQGFSR